VQELWLAGQRDAAAARVPAEIGRATNLLGTPDMIAERLRLYRDAGITTLQAKLGGDHAARLGTLAQLIELVRQISSEPGAVAR
jgi:alkanesulfonate monooxygenase SsuD/methylene tetrahydromethanopterin reductase-like flavin-dependent oxidoreductase (luciferase family)